MATISPIAGPDEAGTQLRSLFKSIETEGFAGKHLKPGRSLRQYIEDIQGLVAGGTDVREILGGRQEAVDAYRSLQGNLSVFDTNMSNTVNAQKTDRFGTMISYTKLLPESLAVQAQRRSANRAELTGERAGIMANLAQAVGDDLVANTRAREGGFGAAMETMWNSIDRFLGGNERFVRNFAPLASPDTQATIRATLSAAERLESAAEKLDSAAASESRTNAARANQAAAGGATEAR